jgi:hypothetical protein
MVQLWRQSITSSSKQETRTQSTTINMTTRSGKTIKGGEADHGGLPIVFEAAARGVDRLEILQLHHH